MHGGLFRIPDETAAEASLRQVEGLLLMTGRNLADHVRDYAVWDDAIERVAELDVFIFEGAEARFYQPQAAELFAGGEVGLPGAFDRAQQGVRHLVAAGLSPQIIMSLLRVNADQIEAVFLVPRDEAPVGLQINDFDLHLAVLDYQLRLDVFPFRYFDDQTAPIAGQ